MPMTFYRHYERPEYLGQENKDKYIVETAGYISVKQQIENFILAGERLQMYRERTYDYTGTFPDPGEGDVIDPTRDPNFDLADYHVMAQKADEALNKVKNTKMEKRKRQKAALEERQAAEKAELEKYRSADPNFKGPEFEGDGTGKALAKKALDSSE